MDEGQNSLMQWTWQFIVREQEWHDRSAFSTGKAQPTVELASQCAASLVVLEKWCVGDG